mgnify:CR=1 FL=1
MPGQEKKNILFLTCRFPYPLHGGDRIKSFHLIKHLAKNNKVTLVTFFQGKEFNNEWKKVIEDLGVELHIVPLKPVKAGLHSIFNNPPNYPLEIYYYKQKSFQKVVDDLLSKNKYDLGISFFLRTADYLKDRKDLKKILIAEDCRILYQQRSYKESTTLLQKMVRYYDHKALQRFEPKTVKYFNYVTLVTNDDIDELKKYAPDGKYYLLTNGTETDYFVPNPEIEKKHIIFTGKLSLWANYLMVEKIVNNIMPLIWKKYPNVKLLVVGASPSREVLKFASEKVEFHQNVKSFLPYLQSAIAFIHPHKGGTGIQNKLLEAMSCGVPVITTKIGNQGINGIHRESIMLGETDVELAKLALEVMDNKELSDKLSKNARELIVQTHSWELINKDLDKLLELVDNN